MKFLIKILILLIISCSYLFAQDSLTTDPNNPAVPTFKPDEDIIDIATNDYGWFPNKFKHFFSIGVNYTSAFVLTRGDNIQSPEFGLGNTAFTSEELFDKNKERKIAKEGKTDRNEYYYPQEHHHLIGASFTYYTPKPVNFTFGISYGVNNSTMLYSEDKTKNYLKSNGEKGEIREVTVLRLKNNTINLSGAMLVDLWGGARSSQAGLFFSTYYLYLGGRYNYSLFNDATAFTQIANVDDKLRYDNLCDTLQYYYNRSLSNVNNTAYIDVGLGVNIGAYQSLTNSTFNGMVIDFRLLLGIPINSLFTDTSCKNWLIGLGMDWSFVL